MIDDETLDRVPFFRTLATGARRELAARGVLRRFEAGEELWRMGAEPRGLFIVLEGEVRVVRSSDGRKHVIHTEGPAGTLGDVPFFTGGTYPATAEATRETLCLALSRDAIVAAIRLDPELAFSFLESLSGRVRQLVDRLDRQVSKSVRARFAEHLLAREAASRSGTFTLGGTQLDVAEELGTVREVLVRTLRELREDGLIASAGRGYEIVDRAALEGIAES